MAVLRRCKGYIYSVYFFSVECAGFASAAPVPGREYHGNLENMIFLSTKTKREQEIGDRKKQGNTT